MRMIKIFSYGSNMLGLRIKNRIDSYSIIGTGYIDNHSLRFHKKSKDESGKADAYYLSTLEEKVWGVIGEIDEKSKNILDRIEGLGMGYNQKEVTVHMSDEISIKALIYVADIDFIDPELKPYGWYKKFVIHGSLENSLPEEYIRKIEKVESIFDNNEERRDKNIQIINNACT